MKPTYVRSIQDLKALEEEFKKSGHTVVYNDDHTFSVYKQGKVIRVVKVRESDESKSA